MKHKFGVILLALAASAAAQTPSSAPRAPAPLAPLAPQNQPVIDLNQIVGAAGLAAQMIDQNREPEIWDGLSPSVKRIAPKDSFVTEIRRVRIPLGPPRARAWLAVAAAFVPQAGNKVGGQFLTVDFATTFAPGKQIIERFSFRLDEDKTWRLAGYLEK